MLSVRYQRCTDTTFQQGKPSGDNVDAYPLPNSVASWLLSFAGTCLQLSFETCCLTRDRNFIADHPRSIIKIGKKNGSTTYEPVLCAQQQTKVPLTRFKLVP